MLKRPSDRCSADNAHGSAGKLSAEMAEIEAIAEKLFSRIEGRVNGLLDIEKRLDAKIARLEELMQMAENAGTAGRTTSNSTEEVLRLSSKGLKIDEIADILDMPKGEVELMLRLKR